MHYRNFIRDQIYILLLNATAAGAAVYRSRVYPVSKQKPQAILIYTNAETAEPDTIGLSTNSTRELDLTIELVIKDQTAPDDVLDNLAQEVEELLLKDCTLSSDVKLIEYTGIEIDLNGDGDNALLVGTLNFNVIYRVENGNPSQPR